MKYTECKSDFLFLLAQSIRQFKTEYYIKQFDLIKKFIINKTNIKIMVSTSFHFSNHFNASINLAKGNSPTLQLQARHF